MLSESFTPIPAGKLSEMIGRPVHLSKPGIRPGCVWILREIKGDRVFLETPKTHRWMVSEAKYVCYTRYWADRIAYESSRNKS